MNSHRHRRLIVLSLLLGGCSVFPTNPFVSNAFGQPPRGEGRSFGRDGDDRGRGERGGDRGGERGGFGRGERGGRGEGGPRFGGPGGGPGGPGGPGGGGFDPSTFLARMDRNGNGMIDQDEMEGPARFMLERLARNNPKIDLSKPVPLSVISEATQQARGGASPDSPAISEEDYSSPTSLVPGFGTKQEKTPVPGFGVNANLLSIRVEERDLRDADERIQRYDRNRDGVLDENELREGRWNDAPMQFDRNGDGKLNRDELAVRFAKRRTEAPATPPPAAQPAGPPSNSSSDENETPAILFETAASYKLNFGTSTPNSKRLQGLPEWFGNLDSNQDGQVSMSEFVRNPSDESIADYARFDANMDGFITPQEGLAAVKNGHVPGSSSGSGSSNSRDSRDSSSGRESSGREGRMGGPGGPRPSFGSRGSSGEVATGANASSASSDSSSSTNSSSVSSAERDRMREWVGRKIGGVDQNKNGKLELDEYKKYNPSGDFSKADKNKDGAIDLEELVTDRLEK